MGVVCYNVQGSTMAEGASRPTIYAAAQQAGILDRGRLLGVAWRGAAERHDATLPVDAVTFSIGQHSSDRATLMAGSRRASR
jgi:hypothetical protein